MNESIMKLLKDRYFLSEEKSWEEVAKRVGVIYPPIENDIKEMKFIPSTPTLINANTKGERIGTLSSCFPMDIEDSIEGIGLSQTECMIVTKFGGGVGYDFSKLRGSKENIQSIKRESSGPLPFINIFNSILDGIQQGGVRRGAGMALLSIEHPDIMKFIKAKNDISKFTRFNFSIKIPDSFYDKLKKTPDANHMIIDKNGNAHPLIYNNKNISVKQLWDEIVHQAWEKAEPGIYNESIAFRQNTVNVNGEAVIPNPCLRDSVNVLTKDGLKQLKDLEVGEYIWSFEGWTQVKKKFPTGNKEVFEYHTTAGVFESTSNHEVVANGEKIPVGESNSIDCLIGVVPSSMEFKTIHTQAIMDGLLLGDESVHKASNNLIYLYIGENDTDYFESEIKDLITKDRTTGLNGWEVKTSLTSEHLCKTFERRIPDEYKYANRNVIYSLLRGLYSANGSICGNRITYKATSFDMIKDIQLLLSSIGIASYYTTNKSKNVMFKNGEYECKESYDLNITGHDKVLFKNFIGFIQKYKTAKLNDIIKKQKRYVKSKTNYDITTVQSIGFHDVYDIEVDNSSHTFWCDGFNISNCSEFCNIPYSSCNLGSINLEKFVDDSGKFQWDKMSQEIEIATKFLNNVIDINNFPIKKIEKTTKSIRPIGLGLMGLAHALYKKKIPYNSNKAIKFTEELVRYTTLKSMQTSIEIAKKEGSYDIFNYDHFVNANARLFTKKKCREIIIDDLLTDLKKYGVRNSCFTSIAPTGSISTIADTSSGIEPVFALTYQRKVEQLNNEYDIMYINDSIFDKYLNDNFTEEKRTKILNEVYENKGSCQKCKDIPEDMRKVFVVAGDMTPMEHLNMLEVVAVNTSLSVSKTINLPHNAKEEDIAKVYLEAHKRGIIGVTVYRDGCREGILIHNNNGAIVEKEAPKRPEDLPCHVYRITVKGEKWVIFVGLYKGHPFEVFAGKVNLVDLPKKIEEGITRKLKSGVYQFIYDDEVIIKNITKIFESGEQEALTRQISMNLRHGTPINYINEQLLKSYGDITSFNKAITRALKKYMQEKESSDTCPMCGERLRYIEGCLSCICGYAKCG